MKKTSLIVIAFLLSVLLCACGGRIPSPATGTDATAPQPTVEWGDDLTVRVTFPEGLTLIETAEKLTLIDSAFVGKLMENTISLLKLLCERNRIELFHECFMDYEKLYNASRQTTFVTVISAVELTDTERERIKASLEAKYKLSVELRCEIDKSIMGGIIIKTDDAIMEGSLSRRLQGVKEVINK